jgi:hypothetical protein
MRYRNGRSVDCRGVRRESFCAPARLRAARARDLERALVRRVSERHIEGGRTAAWGDRLRSMGLQVLGAAWGRTGTLSVKLALERLGFGPCYHMLEVFRTHPEHQALWVDAARGAPIDWEALFDEYRAAVDWPACAFWTELTKAFPDLRTVLVVRDAQHWYESFDATIRAGIPTEEPGADDTTAMMLHEVIFKRSFGGAIDRAHLVDRYEQHVDHVRSLLDGDRLLVWSLTDGWAPLCSFLRVPEPDEPFPRLNDRNDFSRIFVQGGDPVDES